MEYAYQTKYGSPEAAQVKAAGAKWNSDFKVWLSKEPVEGLTPIEANLFLAMHNDFAEKIILTTFGKPTPTQAAALLSYRIRESRIRIANGEKLKQPKEDFVKFISSKVETTINTLSDSFIDECLKILLAEELKKLYI